MKIWSWFLRTTFPDQASGLTAGVGTEACSYCADALLPCADCEGDWRAHPCGNCSLGLRCPTHHTYWLAR